MAPTFWGRAFLKADPIPPPGGGGGYSPARGQGWVSQQLCSSQQPFSSPEAGPPSPGGRSESPWLQWCWVPGPSDPNGRPTEAGGWSQGRAAFSFVNETGGNTHGGLLPLWLSGFVLLGRVFILKFLAQNVWSQ